MISLKNVDFIYNNAKADIGVHQIDLEISKGEVVLLCGSSGCGKTTLTRMINGLIPNFYEGKLSGNITVCGLDVKKSEIQNLNSIQYRQTLKLYSAVKILVWKKS